MKGKAKKALPCLILLLLFAAGVFFIGYGNLKVGVDEIGVVSSKTGGTNKTCIENGVFYWSPAFLLPTNVLIKKFSLAPVVYNKNVSASPVLDSEGKVKSVRLKTKNFFPPSPPLLVQDSSTLSPSDTENEETNKENPADSTEEDREEKESIEENKKESIEEGSNKESLTIKPSPIYSYNFSITYAINKTVLLTLLNKGVIFDNPSLKTYLTNLSNSYIDKVVKNAIKKAYNGGKTFLLDTLESGNIEEAIKSESEKDKSAGIKIAKVFVTSIE